MEWSFDNIWYKSQLYIERAFEEPRESQLFPLYATIGLEFLGRSTLANINPTLVADPQSGDNILYACGLGNVKNPRSVPSKTVFLRCQSIIEEFTKSEFTFVMSMMDKRNGELHSGGLPFEDYPTEKWLADYFRVCEILLDFMELPLEDLFGREEAKIAKQMIARASKDLKSKILKRVGAHETINKDLDEEIREDKIEAWDTKLRSIYSVHKISECPACKNDCLITGEIVKTTEPRLEDDELIIENIVLPTKLVCEVCDLEIKGHESLEVVERGGQFTYEEVLDPFEYYERDFDPDDYYGMEYMNE